MMLLGRRIAHFRRATPASRLLSSSEASSPSSSSSYVGGKVDGDGQRWQGIGHLERRLLSLKYRRRSAAAAISKWVEQGNSIHSKHHLFRIVRHLRKSSRYKHALEVCEWMATQTDFHLQPGDYAVHLDLIAKVRGLTSAEKFFEDLPEQAKNQSTYTSLLYAYVRNNMLSKAESLMEAMIDRRLLTCCLPYNHMINLYLTNGLLDKIPKIMEELKKNVLPDVVTYNLLLTACSASNDLKGAEKFFVEMHQRNVPPDWITYSIITKLYIGNGMPGRARKSLMEMEELVSKEERKAYCSLLTHHANLSDKDDLNRIWDDMKSTFKKMMEPEYSSMIACLVKVGDLERAEIIYSEWESVTGTKDISVPNLLLSGYTRNGMMDKAENFIKETEGKGIRSNYSTWETMALGYLAQNKLDDVLHCLRKAFASLKKWKPDYNLVRAVFDKLEMLGDIETAEQFLLLLRKAGYVTTPIYNSLLRTYEKAGKMPLIILERMKKDNVDPDDETKLLLQSTSKLCIGKVFSLVS